MKGDFYSTDESPEFLKSRIEFYRQQAAAEKCKPKTVRQQWIIDIAHLQISALKRHLDASQPNPSSAGKRPSSAISR